MNDEMILLSIREVYFERIARGEKRYEFRKRLPRGMEQGMKVAVYCTKPVSRIVAWFSVGGLLSGTPQSIWRRTKTAAGIERKKYMEYFHGKNVANAIVIRKLWLLKKPISLKELGGVKSAPQFFVRLNAGQSKKILGAQRTRGQNKKAQYEICD